MTDGTRRAFMGRNLDVFPDTFVCFDIETTGLSPARDDIIEISALKLEDNKITDSFSRLIRINRPLPPFIRSLTGITDDMLRSGDCAESVLADFCDFTAGYIVMGHNVRFDIGFVYDNCLSKLGTFFENDYVDTLSVSRRLLKGLRHHRLDDIVEHFGIEGRTLHRALGDVELTVKCYYKLREQAESAAALK